MNESNNNSNKTINAAFLPENIIQKKQELGFDTGTKNVFIARETTDYAENILMGLLGAGGGNYNDKALISFEETGILIIGVHGILGQYTNRDYFIDVDHLQKLQLEKGAINYLIIIESEDRKFRYKIRHVKSQDYDYHNQSLRHMDDLIHMYQ